MRFKSLCAIAALVTAPFAQAAYVTINEAGMDSVFSQASFGARTVDIRIGAVTTIVRPDLLDLSTSAEITSIFGLHVGAADIVNFYFVDTISACGATINVNIIGCGETPGQDFVVESVFADDSSIPGGGNITVGVQLLSHELGHNLGLAHRSGNFLMNPSINGFQDLNAAEVNTILASPLIHTDANGQRYIQINPVLIVAALLQVPEPSSLMLVLAGALAAGAARRRRQLLPN